MKRQKASRSIRSTLQNTYFLMLVFVFTIFLTYFVISESKKISNNASQSMELNVTTASSYIDNELSTLNTIAQNVSYSNLVKESFSAYVNYIVRSESQLSPSESYSRIENNKILTDLLTSIIGPSQPVSQINIYSLDSGVFGTGHDTYSSSESVKDQLWYEDFIQSGNSYGVYCYPDQRLEKYYTDSKNMLFLSFCCMYYNSYNIPQGVIEVKNPLTSMIQKIEALGNLYGEKIYIYDSNGTLIYSSSNETTDYFSLLPWDHSKKISDSVYSDTISGNIQLFYTMDKRDCFTSVVAVSNKQLWTPIWEYINVNILIFAVICMITFFLSTLISRVITNPITTIYQQLKSFPGVIENRQEVPIIPEIDTHILELNTLYSALIKMQKKVITSMDHEVALHNQEMQSKMLALQSQMNPHFLYNSLATIQSMADEKMDDEIIVMCQTISRILRYISSDKESLVPLQEDLAHMTDYLICMKIRYDDDLIYDIDIPEAMMDIHIPKLCLQLIVENSIKFTTKAVHAPWKIHVSGILTASRWEISICDNGPGFSDEDIRILENRIASINETGLLPSLELNGMGLMNIYIRFKLLYKGNHIFKVCNHPSGGAVVIIGGNLQK